MKKKFFSTLILLFLSINSASGANQELIKKFALQETLNPHNLPTTLSLFEDTNSDKVEWSILITTIVKRNAMFTQLLRSLMRQIISCGLGKKIEVIFYRDDCKKSVGYKRNQLLKNARGKYVCFVDDDDFVHPKYIKMIYEKLQTNPDCVKLVGIMTYNKKKTFKRIHSIENKEYKNTKEVLYRPPTHINPIRRSIAIQFKFPEYDFSEDKWWTMEICKSGLLKTEAKIETPYYFYNFDEEKSETWRKRHIALKQYVDDRKNKN